LERVIRTVAVLVGHLVIAAAIVGAIWATHRIVATVWSGEQPVFFGWVPLSWFFDASEVGVIAVFAISSIVDMIRALLRRDEGQQ
jgi:TRAP-type C4-dicarboxylate transport system permease small subunit